MLDKTLSYSGRYIGYTYYNDDVDKIKLIFETMIIILY